MEHLTLSALISELILMWLLCHMKFYHQLSFLSLVLHVLMLRFKAKGSTGGDNKGRAKVEPYAYWQFDRKVGQEHGKGRDGEWRGEEGGRREVEGWERGEQPSVLCPLIIFGAVHGVWVRSSFPHILSMDFTRAVIHRVMAIVCHLLITP